MGNPLLREEAKPFTFEEILSEDTEILLKDMWDSLEEAGGIGLAAPQIGISKQLAIIKLSEESDRYPDMETSEAYIIFNPKMTCSPSLPVSFLWTFIYYFILKF